MKELAKRFGYNYDIYSTTRSLSYEEQETLRIYLGVEATYTHNYNISIHTKVFKPRAYFGAKNIIWEYDRTIYGK